MAKPSRRQRWVLEKMFSGWTLSHFSLMEPPAKITREIGDRRRMYEPLRDATFDALVRGGWVVNRDGPGRLDGLYVLTEAGLALVDDEARTGVSEQ